MQNNTETTVTAPDVVLADALADFLHSHGESDCWQNRCNDELVMALRKFVRAELRQMLTNV